MAKKTPQKKKAAKKAAPKGKTATHKVTVENKKFTITPLFASESTLVEGAEQQAWERGDSIGATDEGDAIRCERDTSGE